MDQAKLNRAKPNGSGILNQTSWLLAWFSQLKHDLQKTLFEVLSHVQSPRLVRNFWFLLAMMMYDDDDDDTPAVSLSLLPLLDLEL